MTSSRSLATALVLLAAAALPAGAAQGATHHHVKRAQLKVSAGKVQGAATGYLRGTFSVSNVGDATAPKSKARMSVRTSSRKWTSVKTYTIPRLKPGRRQVLTFTRVALPKHLPARALSVRVCDGASCRTVGSTKVVAPRTTAPATTTAPGTTAAPGPVAPTPTGPPVRPADTTPAHPIAYNTDDLTHLYDAQSDYYIYVPHAYDATNRTPTELFVWMHGCYNQSRDDAYTISNASQTYITLSLGGRDNDCWDVNTDGAKVFAAIADMEDHFNIDQRRIIIGGYSSGGDLAYRTAFYNAYTFAGVLAMNTAPFRDTGSTGPQSIAAAAWKFHIVHLAHTSDEAYDINEVKSEIGQLSAAQFPVQLIERPGTHHDDNTYPDLQQYLLPHLNDGWTAP